MKDKIRILMPIEYYYPIGGIERFVTNLCNEFFNEFEIIWAVEKIGGNFRINYPKNVQVLELKFPRLQIPSLVDKLKPDILFINNAMLFNFIAMVSARIRRIPIVFFCHQIPVYRETSIFDRTINSLIWLYLRIVVTLSDKFIVPSKAVLREFQERGFSKTPKVMYPGVNVDQFKSISSDQKNNLKSKYQLTPEKKVVSWVGRFSPEKNVRMLVDLAKALPEITFVIAGFKPAAKSSFSDFVIIKSSDLSNIKIVEAGPDKIQEIYQISDVYVSTSVYETFGSTIAEAAACGITTVAPSHSGAVESGAGGYLYDYNLKSLIEVVEKAIKKPLLSKNVTTSHENAVELEKIFESLIN